jgi:hypothetical protein
VGGASDRTAGSSAGRNKLAYAYHHHLVTPGSHYLACLCHPACHNAPSPDMTRPPPPPTPRHLPCAHVPPARLDPTPLPPTPCQELAATPADSQQRFNSRVLLPGMAKRLREAGPAAPVVAGQYIAGGDKEATLSVEYGGTASGNDAVSGDVHVRGCQAGCGHAGAGVPSSCRAVRRAFACCCW